MAVGPEQGQQCLLLLEHADRLAQASLPPPAVCASSGQAAPQAGLRHLQGVGEPAGQQQTGVVDGRPDGGIDQTAQVVGPQQPLERRLASDVGRRRGAPVGQLRRRRVLLGDAVQPPVKAEAQGLLGAAACGNCG